MGDTTRMVRWAGLVLAAVWAVGCASGCTKEKSRPFRLTSAVESRGSDFATALFQTTGARMVPGNEARWALNGNAFDVASDEIRKARSSVHVLMFIWRPGKASDQLLEALAARDREHVKCRVLVDPIGSPTFEKDIQPRLKELGCESHLFRPLPADENLARNHRKLVIVDGKVGLTGGVCVQDEWLGEARNEKEWRDTNVRVEGPVVSQMQQAFAENWQEVTGELLPPEDFPGLAQPAPGVTAEGEGWAAFVGSTANPELTRAERLTQLMVRAAKRRLWISQAYFTPNDSLRALLVEAARAGVDVRVLAPGDKNDQKVMTVAQREKYGPMLEAGVRIWEFQPAMMHAKTMLVDDRLVVVGSINYDPLSFNMLEEGALVLEDARAAREMEAFFLADLERAKEVPRPAAASARR